MISFQSKNQPKEKVKNTIKAFLGISSILYGVLIITGAYMWQAALIGCLFILMGSFLISLRDAKLLVVDSSKEVFALEDRCLQELLEECKSKIQKLDSEKNNLIAIVGPAPGGTMPFEAGKINGLEKGLAALRRVQYSIEGFIQRKKGVI